MTKTPLLPKGRNHAGKLAASRSLVSTALSEGESWARSSNQKKFKRLTKAELANRRSKGFCVTCNQTFTPGHIDRCVCCCTLQVLLVDKENFSDKAKVSRSSMPSFTNNHVMRLRGLIGGEEIVVLTDSGSSYNLISANLVKKLGIQVTDTAPFGIILANGVIVRDQGICKGVKISFPELQVVEDFLHWKMCSASCQDVILGIKWLKTLGDVMVNWQLRTMTIDSDIGKVTLKGDLGLVPSSIAPAMAKVSLNPLMKLKGILGGVEIVVLIDSGASNNVISANLVERLGIMVMDTSPLSSILLNGNIVRNQGICKGVIISFPELQVVEDFEVFNMGNTCHQDVILGIQWLKTLGDVMMNWQLLTMTFGSASDGGKITLSGKTMAQGRNKKLAPKFYGPGQIIKKLTRKFYGPYQIVNRVGKAGYALQLPKALNGLILYKRKIAEAFGRLIKKGSTLYKNKTLSTGRAKMV